MQTASELLIKYQVSVSNMERHQTNLELNETKLQENETALKDWNHAKILLELLKNFKLEKRKEFILVTKPCPKEGIQRRTAKPEPGEGVAATGVPSPQSESPMTRAFPLKL